MDTHELDKDRPHLLIGLAVLVLIVSIIPIPEFIGTGANRRSVSLVFHLIGYALLALIAQPIVASHIKRARWQVAIITVGGITGYGVLIELLQAPIPYRTSSIIDVAINAIGAIIGVVTGQQFSKRV